MWVVKNRTPYLADRTFVMDKDGRTHWVVVVKATFDILPDGTTKLAEEQLAIKLLPEYHGKDDGTSSLKWEADMIAGKPGTDVLVVGNARSPGQRAVQKLSVLLRLGKLNKALEVQGDRTWSSVFGRVSSTQPAPFVSMPLVYERAFGGADLASPDLKRQGQCDQNTVGTGFAVDRRQLQGQAVANIEAVHKSPSDSPAGFGAISSYWQPRLSYAGTYDAAWVKQRKPLWPNDYDSRYLMCAPPDQQFYPHLRGGEPVGILNMSDSGVLQFALPKVFLAYTTKIAKRTEEHRGSLNTVIIEPDYPRVTMVWHTSLECHHEVELLSETVVKEKRYV